MFGVDSAFYFVLKDYHAHYMIVWDYPSSQSLIACMTASVVMIFKFELFPTSKLAMQRNKSEYGIQSVTEYLLRQL
ncbi:MAG: hypothetical protein V8S08_09440 [Lachnoclostridium sp.]